MSKCVTVAIAGFGLRGRDYANYQFQHPNKMKIVAIAETNNQRLLDATEKFGISKENCFTSAEEMLEHPQLADIMFITTQDRQHVPQAIKAMEKGYHIMMEKPISPDLDECLQIQQKAHELGKVVAVCHVMRYTVFFEKIKEAILSGKIGEIKSIQALENVGYYHHAHSFVRGNWRRTDEASPMILAKSCHDLDLIQWLIDKRCTYISSFGDLSLFKEENAPEGSSDRCLNQCACQDDCPYDAEKIYVTDSITGVRNGIWKWPCTAVVHNPTEETIYEALRTGPYGRCVYRCDNDVVDHQVVIMEFEGKETATFTMSAFTVSDERHIKIMGTKGDIIADLESCLVNITPFGQKTEVIDINAIADNNDGGHSGGDLRIVDNVVNMIANGNIGDNLTSIDASIHSHVMALAAEYSRLNHGKSIKLDDFIKQNENN